MMKTIKLIAFSILLTSLTATKTTATVVPTTVVDPIIVVDPDNLCERYPWLAICSDLPTVEQCKSMCDDAYNVCMSITTTPTDVLTCQNKRNVCYHTCDTM